VGPLTLLQAATAVVVLGRLARGRTRRPPLRLGAAAPAGPKISVVVPARDEERRLGRCLEGLMADGDLREVIVVDDESRDGTAELAAARGASVLRGEPLPPGWAGKAWALEQGLGAARGDIVLFLDADARPRPGLSRTLAAALADADLLSAGPRFVSRSAGERLLHPALLATLVYRFGPADVEGFEPAPARALANGQCLLVRRERLLEAGGWASVRGHLTEDVALARHFVAQGRRIAFVDASDLLEVEMYGGALNTWRGWGRSIAMADVTPPSMRAFDAATVWLCQALPLLRVAARRAGPIDWVLLAVRLALQVGLARSYRPRGPAFWLAPMVDAGAALRLSWSALRPSRSWRGRSYPASGRRGRPRTSSVRPSPRPPRSARAAAG
jgi:dolichol-phosphate mannosyltransferase